MTKMNLGCNGEQRYDEPGLAKTYRNEKHTSSRKEVLKDLTFASEEAAAPVNSPSSEKVRMPLSIQAVV